MQADHINLLWAKLLFEELSRSGITLVCVSPGSRSTPLALAAAENPRIRTVVHYDERGASFCALGYARATGKPAAVVCTSGTAVANCFPAVVEASQSCVPLIIISADRPPELQDTGALQTIDQVGIFGKFTRWEFSFPTPDEHISPAFILSTVDHACYCATHSPAGAVHLNCMFREPLAPTGDDPDWVKYLTPIQVWLKSGKPYTEYLSAEGTDLYNVAVVTDQIRSAKKGIIVAGPLPVWQDKRDILDLATKLGWPIFADICSDLRNCGISSQQLLNHYDLYLRSPELRKHLAPDFILQFGGTPISKHLLRYLNESCARWIVVNDHPFRQDIEHHVSNRVIANVPSIAAALTSGVTECRSTIANALFEADQIAGQTLHRYITTHSDQPLELSAGCEVFTQISDPRGVYLATSMPIRDAEAGVCPNDQRIYVAANRGVNGIDGTLASAVGFADGLQLPVTLVIGDLALLHDLNSMVLVRQSRQTITIVVINNNGGGIFSFLPVAKATGQFESCFGTPHGMSFKNVAMQFGLSYSIARQHSELKQQLAGAYKSNTSQMIEVVSDRELNLKQHEQLWQEVIDAIRVSPTNS